MNKAVLNAEGGCCCGKLRYKIDTHQPLIVHCCHCKICQRQTGSAFAINALFDAQDIKLLKGEVSVMTEQTPSGRGQTIARCTSCHVAIWSNYFMGGIKEKIRFLRVGTLDQPDLMPPDVHIYTISKQTWLTLPSNAITHDKFYDFASTWSLNNNQHRLTLLGADN